jgi:hypothetical protein
MDDRRDRSYAGEVLTGKSPEVRALACRLRFAPSMLGPPPRQSITGAGRHATLPRSVVDVATTGE